MQQGSTFRVVSEASENPYHYLVNLKYPSKAIQEAKNCTTYFSLIENGLFTLIAFLRPYMWAISKSICDQIGSKLITSKLYHSPTNCTYLHNK